MIKNIVASVCAVAVIAIGAMVVTPTPASALNSDPSCVNNEKSIFGIVPWYRGLLHGTDCSVTLPSASSGGDKNATSISSFIIMIALNILQAGLSVAAYVTIFFIIKGGFMYMTSTGSPDGMTNAKKTITNAIIGLIIAVLSAAIVNAIAGVIK